MPIDLKGLEVCALNSHLLAFDNVSYFKKDMQDHLCILSTGGQVSSRALYTNGEEHIVELSNPVIINGITELASRSDLISRLVRLTLMKGEVGSISKLKEEFKQDLPAILGQLLNLFVKTLSSPVKNVDQSVRLQDFALLGESIKAGFTARLKQMQGNAAGSFIDSNAAAEVIVKYFEDKPNGHTLEASVGDVWDMARAGQFTGRTNYRSPRAWGSDLTRAKSELWDIYRIRIEWIEVRSKVRHLRITKGEELTTEDKHVLRVYEQLTHPPILEIQKVVREVAMRQVATEVLAQV